MNDSIVSASPYQRMVVLPTLLVFVAETFLPFTAKKSPTSLVLDDYTARPLNKTAQYFVDDLGVLGTYMGSNGQNTVTSAYQRPLPYGAVALYLRDRLASRLRQAGLKLAPNWDDTLLSSWRDDFVSVIQHLGTLDGQQAPTTQPIISTGLIRVAVEVDSGFVLRAFSVRHSGNTPL